MRVLSLNILDAQQVEFRDKTVGTGIFKRSVDGPVRATRLTLEGDRQVDLRYHGVEHKAVYLHPHEHYPQWSDVLEEPDLPMGKFGENFTTEGLLETDVHIGDRFAIGTAEFEITQPRVPCFKLGIAVGDPHFVKTFLQSERSGFYARVITVGNVQAGDLIKPTFTHPEAVTVQYIHHLYFQDSTNRKEIERVLEIEALSKEWKRQLRDL